MLLKGLAIALLSYAVLGQIEGDEIIPMSAIETPDMAPPPVHAATSSPASDDFWKETLNAFLETKRYDLFQQKIQEPDVLKALTNEQLDAVVESASSHHFLFASMTDFFLRQDIVSRIPGQHLGSIFYKLIENNEYGAAAKIVKNGAFSSVPKDKLDASLTLLAKKLQKRKIIPFWEKKYSNPNTDLVHAFLSSPQVIQRIPVKAWSTLLYLSVAGNEQELAKEIVTKVPQINQYKAVMHQISKQEAVNVDFFRVFVENTEKNQSIKPIEWGNVLYNLIKKKDYDAAAVLTNNDAIWAKIPPKTKAKIAKVKGYERVHNLPPKITAFFAEVPKSMTGRYKHVIV